MASHIFANTLRSRTTGGKGGATTTVTTLAALQAAAAGNTPAIILVSGTITGSNADVVDIGSNKSVLGKAGAGMIILQLKFSALTHISVIALVGVGLRVVKNKNVIIRNLKISKGVHISLFLS